MKINKQLIKIEDTRNVINWLTAILSMFWMYDVLTDQYVQYASVWGYFALMCGIISLVVTMYLKWMEK